MFITVCKSRVEISHRLMEISLNLMGFTDLFYKKMLTSLISFSSTNTFLLNLLLKSDFKRSLGYKIIMTFLQFFLCDQPYQFRDISQTSELKSTTEIVSGSTWFIHFYGLFNYLNSFQKQPTANFLNNSNCYFPAQKHVSDCTNKFTDTELDFFVKYLLRAI